MQSTVRPLAPSEMSDKIQFLSNCLNETNFSESLESQSETAGRCNEIAAFTLMQQSRRMLQRPLSIAGVQVADGNRFFVNLGSQAETCARPLVINDTMFNRPTSNHQTPQSQATHTTQLLQMDNRGQTPQGQKPQSQTPQSQTPHHQTLQHQTFHQETLQHKEELKMPTATHTTPFAWDFRAQLNGVDAIGVDRSWDCGVGQKIPIVSRPCTVPKFGANSLVFRECQLWLKSKTIRSRCRKPARTFGRSYEPRSTTHYVPHKGLQT